MNSHRAAPVEIELKYGSEDMAPLELLLSQDELAGFRFRKLPDHHVVDRYFDTPDEDLRRHGLALRIRKLGKKVLATVKSLGSGEEGLHRREEIEVVLPEGADPLVFGGGPIQERIGALVGGKDLREVCEITQKRRRRLLSRDSEESMELSVDEVTVSLGDQARTFYEVESELRPGGSEEDLHQLKETLDRLDLEPIAASKLERALEMMRQKNGFDPDSPDADSSRFGLSPDDGLRKAFLRILRYYYRRFLKSEKGTRKGKDVEDLHRMRVASRKIRAVIFLFRPALKDPRLKEIDRLMKRATDQLGLVRDFDVLLEKLALYAAEQKPEAQADLKVLQEFWEACRDKNRKDLIDYLSGAKFRSLRKEYQRFFKTYRKEIRTSGAPEGIPEKLIRHAVPGMIWKAYEEVQKFEAIVREAPNETFHALRIEAKHLRYALEMFTDVLDDSVQDLIQKVTRLQEHLGDLQDAEVTDLLLKEFLDSPGKKWRDLVTPSVQKTLKAYRRHLEKIQRHQKWSFEEVWEPVCGEDYRNRLSNLLVKI